MAESVGFTELYKYQTKNGIVLPETNDVLGKVQDIFIEKFGSAFDLTPESVNGRIIEVLTMVMKDAICIAATNANGFNPKQAVGAYLDAIGDIFGIARQPDETDFSLRERIMTNASRGTGYPASIRNELSKVEGVRAICVLENGSGDPAVMPVGGGENAVMVDPHAVLVCLGVSPEGETEEELALSLNDIENEVARAVYRTKGMGCAYHQAVDGEYGRRVDKTITVVEDPSLAQGTLVNVTFYEAMRKEYRIHAVLRDDVYTGTDIVTDARDAILTFVRSNNINFTITEGDVSSAVASSGTGIVATSSVFELRTGENVWTRVPSMVMRPYEYAEVAEENVTFEVV